MKKTVFSAFWLLATPLALFSGCKKDSDAQYTTGTVSFTVQNVAPMKVRNSVTLQVRPLTLNQDTAITAANEQFKVSVFEYYISNIKFTKSDGSTYAAPDTYFLVDQATPASLSFSVPNVPVGEYTGVSYVVGVDAQRTGLTDPLSFTGAIEALNPAKNMYWGWNSGHIFLKMEGSLISTTPNVAMTCHIGGYTAPYSAIVTAAPSFNGVKLNVQTDRTSYIGLRANVTKMFDGPTTFKLSTFDFSNAHMPSAQSVQLAQNYAAGMFSVSSISSN